MTAFPLESPCRGLMALDCTKGKNNVIGGDLSRRGPGIQLSTAKMEGIVP